MIDPSATAGKWTERSSAPATQLPHSAAMFQLLFERSADAIWLFDPQDLALVDCNAAAVELLRARDKAQVLSARSCEICPGVLDQQCGGIVNGLTVCVNQQATRRFEGIGRRFDGTEAPLEVIATPIVDNGRTLNVVIARDISERKRAEQEIRELNQTLERRILERTAELTASEAQFRTLIDHAPEAIVVFASDTGRFVACNANATRLCGLSREQLLQLTPGQISPEFQLDGRPSQVVASEKIRLALEGATPNFEWVHRHSDGRHIPCEVRLVRLPGDASPPLIRASIIDNTERKRREKVQQATFQISEAVHTAEDLPSLYRLIHRIISGLMPAANFYIALFDPATEMISFAYYVDESSSKSPPPQPMNTGLTSVVLRTGKALLAGRALESRKKKFGEEVIFDGIEGARYKESGAPAAIWLGVPLLLAGRTVGVVAVQDYQNENAYGEGDEQILAFVAGQIALAIERKRIQQAIRESEEKFRALFEASSQGVILHDEEKMLEVNPACLRILGFTAPEEMIGKHPSEASAPIQPNGERADVLARKYISECIQTGSARFDWLARNSRGREIPIEIVLTRIELGGRSLIQAVFNDITQRKHAEAELLKTLAREKELGQLKSNFVSMVSHEFRTPLGVIQSSAEILQDYFSRLDPAERAEQLRSIIKNTRRMAELMEEVLVLSRLDAGKMQFQPAPLDLAACCRKVVDEVRSATEHRCKIELVLSDGCPPAQGDERLLAHIFTNLLTNAVKYSEPGALVQFTIEPDNGEAICRIADQGIGIPEADLPWLFNAFHRGRNVGDRPGTGLGLVLVKRCVELHGGSIHLQSRIREGTTVTLRLPMFSRET